MTLSSQVLLRAAFVLAAGFLVALAASPLMQIAARIAERP
jgi:hypothetical protein